ncbi:hypothetical protein CHUAL_001626 [Chamberlinius hualienensis]
MLPKLFQLFRSLIIFPLLLFVVLNAEETENGVMFSDEDTQGFGTGFPVHLNCSSMSSDLVDEIASYRPVAEEIRNFILNGPMKGFTYNFLATFVDKFGSRLTGTQNLEDSIDYIVDWMRENQLSNIHTENVTVPVWRRGHETLTMLQPRYKPLALLGLGNSIATPPEGITGEIIVVRNFTELAEKGDQVPGKIVVSAATTSIYSPHTGWQDYDTDVSPVKIPVACITIEDADMFKRMTDRGDPVVVNLYMEAQSFPDGISRNTVAECRIIVLQAVIVSGHIDSWDVGQGAMDDGGGSFISIMAPYVLSQLGLVTKRPVRTVLWTSEETGNFNGAYAYANEHANELDDINIVMESDEGTAKPWGLTYSGTDDAACIIQEILKLTDSINATQLFRPDLGSDTPVFSDLGVPTSSLVTFAANYFDFHHSNGDTMTVLNPDWMDESLVLWTVSSYVLANITEKLPR